MTERYEITLEMEVLRELAGSIDASYFRYMDKHGIDLSDKTNQVAIYSWEVVAAKDKILFCGTPEELRLIAAHLKELRAIIVKLEEEDGTAG